MRKFSTGSWKSSCATARTNHSHRNATSLITAVKTRWSLFILTSIVADLFVLIDLRLALPSLVAVSFVSSGNPKTQFSMTSSYEQNIQTGYPLNNQNDKTTNLSNKLLLRTIPFHQTTLFSLRSSWWSSPFKSKTAAARPKSEPNANLSKCIKCKNHQIKNNCIWFY